MNNNQQNIPEFSMPSDEDMNVKNIYEQRIFELEHQLHKLINDNEYVPYNHNCDDIAQSVSIPEENLIELEKIIKFWLYKKTPMSQMFERIETAPMTLREKLMMVFIMTSVIAQKQPSGPKGPQGGPQMGFMTQQQMDAILKMMGGMK